ncbi:MAG: FliM/FliN family flagellar motor switch protein [Polyangiaceae bacterium]|nr:FliM/FliN family flagellar motor switch protein [Polyangiaceae bacterium]
MRTARAHYQPFPWRSIEALTRHEIAIQARLLRIGRALVDVDAVMASLSELAGQPIEIRFRRIRTAHPRHSADDAVGVIVSRSETRALSQSFLIDLDGALAATLITKALGQRAPRITDHSRTASPAIAGAAAAIVLATLQRAQAPGAVDTLRVVAAGPAVALVRDLASADPALTTAWFTILIGRDAFDARITLREMMEAPSDEANKTKSALERLGDAPLAVPLVVATTLADRADVESLLVGDAFVPGSFPLSIGKEGALKGRVAMVVGTSEMGIGAELAENGQLMIRELAEAHSWDPPSSENSENHEKKEAMSEETNATATATGDVLDDVPVVVRVELGVVEMTARKWAAIHPGDVLAIGRKIGAPAVLRVGGVEIARGELVQIDGEYAVRILKSGGSR